MVSLDGDVSFPQVNLAFCCLPPAHNVIIRIFFFFACFGDALSTTAQAFLPGLINRSETAVAKVVRRLVFIGIGLGGLNAAVAGLIPFQAPSLFTTDPLIIADMQRLAPLLSGSLLVHACTMVLEGVLLAQKDLAYLATCYAVSG